MCDNSCGDLEIPRNEVRERMWKYHLYFSEVRERTLSMKEGGPEGFTNFSKIFRSPGDHRLKYLMAQ